MTDKPWTAPGVSIPERASLLATELGIIIGDENKLLEATIAVLTPLAEEGRKHLVRRLAALELIESGAYHPKRLNPEISRDISAAYGDGEIVNVADGISPWFELTDKGRERLVYLRGLVGEEKAR